MSSTSGSRDHRRSASLEDEMFAATSGNGGFVTAPTRRQEPTERSPAPLASYLERQRASYGEPTPPPGEDGDDACDSDDGDRSSCSEGDESSSADDDDDESSAYDSEGAALHDDHHRHLHVTAPLTPARPRGASLSALPATRPRSPSSRGMSGGFTYDDDDVAEMNAREQELLVNIQEIQRQLSMVQIQTEKPQEEMLRPAGDSRQRLIMVSNRLPISFQRNETTGELSFKMSSGGLVTALNGIRDEVPFVWIGWLGEEIAHEDQNKIREKLAEEFNCVPVFLSKEIASRYYNDFSNDILWPTFHYVPLPLFRAGSEKKFDFRLWDAYKLANKLFAQAVNQVYREGDYVWIHDYHLMNLPSLLRKRHPKCKIGWFLHTPFPSSEVYRSLPVGKQILEGLLGADLLGFHTYDYARHFLSACSRIPGATSSPKGIEWEDHFSAVGVFPIGIDPEHFENLLATNEAQQRVKELTEKFKGCKIIIGVDRMDYIKGIPHRLLAMERFLAMYPERRENVVLIQIAVPSRTDVVEYQNLAASVNEMVGRINGRYGTLQHSPVHYIHRPVAPTELVALYNIADACLVTSLRDGMNLVSHEYVMCQTQPCEPHREGPGVLILSEFAGSAQSLSGAIRVNPWNTSEIASAIEYAFTLTPMEREYRQMNLHRYVKTHSASYWGKSFLADLEYTVSRPSSTRKLVKLPTMDVINAYSRSKRRMIVLDYEGTLLDEPHQRATIAPPKPFIKRLIESLAADKKNTVLLVSGHERGVIGSWLNDRRVGVVAESGYFYRLPHTDEWEMMTEDHDPSWKKVVRPIMQYFTERTPGSFIETKESSLTWHYGETDPIFGPMQARDMQVNLEDVLCSLPLEVLQGTNNVEVRLQGVTKTVLIDEILKLYEQQQQQHQPTSPPTISRSTSSSSTQSVKTRLPPIDFVFCAGNGLEDDDLFTFFQEHHDHAKQQQATTTTTAAVGAAGKTTAAANTAAAGGNGSTTTTSAPATPARSSLLSSLPPGVPRPPTPSQPATPETPATPTVELRSAPKGSSALAPNPHVYTCHIGANKTEAMYYLERPSDLLRVLRSLSAQSREGYVAHENNADTELTGSSPPSATYVPTSTSPP